MSAPTETSITFDPSGRALACDVLNVDLNQPLSDDEVADIKTAWYQHLVLRFRDQDLTDANLVAFTKRLGMIEKAPARSATQVLDSPESHYVLTISNVIEGGAPIGELGDGEAVWHQDMTFRPVAPVAAALYALELPADGGNTEFCNLYAAYESLPANIQERIEGLSCIHDITLDSSGRPRKGYTVTTDPRNAQGPTHPLVRTHPRTGRKHLYLGRRPFAFIPSLSLEESEDLLNLLWSHCAQPSLKWTQVWRKGDLVLWDNRCTMHRRDSFDPSERRVLHRTQLADDSSTSHS